MSRQGPTWTEHDGYTSHLTNDSQLLVEDLNICDEPGLSATPSDQDGIDNRRFLFTSGCLQESPP